jgi:hypothetical protein
MQSFLPKGNTPTDVSLLANKEESSYDHKEKMIENSGISCLKPSEGR